MTIKSQFIYLKKDCIDFIKDARLKLTFWSTLICGLITYIYLITNNIYNHDGIYLNPTGYGFGLGVGRWLLEILGSFSTKLQIDYYIPVYKIGLGLVFIVIASLYLVRLLDIKNKYLCACVGPILAVFPSIVGAMLHGFTAHYYMLGLLFAVSSVYYASRKGWLCTIISISLLLMSLGIYQAYLPVATSLLVIICIKNCLDNKNYKEILFMGIKCILILIASYIGYLICLNICLKVTGIAIYPSQGVEKMGVIQFDTILNQLISCYSELLNLPFINLLGVSSTIIIRACYLITYILIFIMSIIFIINAFVKKKNLGSAFIYILLLFIFPIVALFINIMINSNTNKHTLMLSGIMSVFYLLIILAEWVFQNIKSKLTLVLSVLVLFCTIANFSFQANGNYTRLHYLNKHVEFYYSNLISRVISSDNYSRDLEIILVGSTLNDSNIIDSWDPEIFNNMGSTMGINIYSKNNIILNILGYKTRTISIDSDEYKLYEDTISKLSTYPLDNSIEVVGDVVLVRLE